MRSYQISFMFATLSFGSQSIRADCMSSCCGGASNETDKTDKTNETGGVSDSDKTEEAGVKGKGFLAPHKPYICPSGGGGWGVGKTKTVLIEKPSLDDLQSSVVSHELDAFRDLVKLKLSGAISEEADSKRLDLLEMLIALEKDEKVRGSNTRILFSEPLRKQFIADLEKLYEIRVVEDKKRWVELVENASSATQTQNRHLQHPLSDPNLDSKTSILRKENTFTQMEGAIAENFFPEGRLPDDLQAALAAVEVEDKTRKPDLDPYASAQPDTKSIAELREVMKRHKVVETEYSRTFTSVFSQKAFAQVHMHVDFLPNSLARIIYSMFGNDSIFLSPGLDYVNHQIYWPHATSVSFLHVSDLECFITDEKPFFKPVKFGMTAYHDHTTGTYVELLHSTPRNGKPDDPDVPRKVMRLDDVGNGNIENNNPTRFDC